ncbi:hypothetical protein CBL_02048 [Carabus blaptoides fortunei]
MNSLIVVLCLALASANAVPSLLLGGAATLVGPGNPGAILQGPVGKATVAGPDGSLIGAAANAGALLAAPQRGGIVSAAVAPGLVGLTAPGLIASPLGLGGVGTGLLGPGILKV